MSNEENKSDVQNKKSKISKNNPTKKIKNKKSKKKTAKLIQEEEKVGEIERIAELQQEYPDVESNFLESGSLVTEESLLENQEKEKQVEETIHEIITESEHSVEMSAENAVPVAEMQEAVLNTPVSSIMDEIDELDAIVPEVANDEFVELNVGFRYRIRHGRFWKLVQTILRPMAPEMPIQRMLLPNERSIDSVLLIFFEEVQIFIGILILLIGTGLLFFDVEKIYVVSIIIFSIITIITGSMSEEIHVTNQRILVRRIDLLERIFRIPRDCQYLITQIVSFQVGRAPVNRLLLLPSLLIAILDIMFPMHILIRIGIVAVLIPILFFALRINKRAMSFQLSGGHSVILGAEKGIPLHLVDTLSEILLTENLIVPTNLEVNSR